MAPKTKPPARGSVRLAPVPSINVAQLKAAHQPERKTLTVTPKFKYVKGARVRV